MLQRPSVVRGGRMWVTKPAVWFKGKGTGVENGVMVHVPGIQRDVGARWENVVGIRDGLP